jgi:hypothetical protein
MRKTERFSVKQIVYGTATPAFRVQGRMPDGSQIRRNVPTFHGALQVKEELELKAQGQPDYLRLERRAPVFNYARRP